MLEHLDLDEAKQSQLPFAELLINLGYSYLSKDEVRKQRYDDTRGFLLSELATEQLMRLNHNKFGKAELRRIVNDLDTLGHNDYKGLIETSQEIFTTIMARKGGRTISSQSLRFFDFDEPRNNSFHLALETEFQGKSRIRPDIVCFVNGIPLAIIECKRSSVEVKEAVSQMITNQAPEYCPRLYTYAQLLVATTTNELLYGATGAKAKFYVNWREADEGQDSAKRIRELIAQPIASSCYAKLLQDLPGRHENHQQNTTREPTEQDRGAFALFQPERLLDLVRNHIVFDGGVKKIARSSQYFAIRKIKDRIHQFETGTAGKPGRRRGGLVWHTQGTGKSILMVMFIKALIEDPKVTNPRIIVVTDRKDLHHQITQTLSSCGIKKGIVEAKSGRHLLELIKHKDLRIITSLVHKFNSLGANREGFKDDDPNIFVIVDEAHRTQGGNANLEMNRVLTNACFLAFTGTPLMKKERESWRKFGDYIDRYTIDKAQRDNVIIPLVYEGRYAKLRQDSKGLDKKFDRMTEDKPLAVREEATKLPQKNWLPEIPAVIQEIAHDIQEHYIANFHNTGLKGQVVAPSKSAAVEFQQAFEMSGKVRTAVVISADNTKQSYADQETHADKEKVRKFLQKIRARQSLEAYEKEVISSFRDKEDGIELIIVVDKLLTGFDAPRNTVLYLAKRTEEHNLLQAIARVNRVFENPKQPKNKGFIIDYSENAKNLEEAIELFSSYDTEDVSNALIDSKAKIEEFKVGFEELKAIFSSLGNKDDNEAYIQHLADEETREDFYEKLRAVLRSFKDCLVLGDFIRQEEDGELDSYRQVLKKLMEIRKSASLRYADRLDMSEYKEKLKVILDDNIRVDEIELLTKPVDIYDAASFTKALEGLGSVKSQAEAVSAQLNAVIVLEQDKDPEYYKTLSARIAAIIEEMRDSKLDDAAALAKLAKLEGIRVELVEKGQKRQVADDLPPTLSEHPVASILYRNLKDCFPGEPTQYAKIVERMTEIIQQNAIIDWHRNSQVQADIASKLDDYLYDTVVNEYGIKLGPSERENIIDKVQQLALNNYEKFAV